MSQTVGRALQLDEWPDLEIAERPWASGRQWRVTATEAQWIAIRAAAQRIADNVDARWPAVTRTLCRRFVKQSRR